MIRNYADIRSTSQKMTLDSITPHVSIERVMNGFLVRIQCDTYVAADLSAVVALLAEHYKGVE